MRLSDPSIVMLAMSSLAALTVTVKVIANAVVRTLEHSRKRAELAVPSISDDRLARLESAVEAIAIEVERISEGQRFTTRLLTEQKPQMPLELPRPGRFDTPH